MVDEADALARAVESLARHLVNEEGLDATLGAGGRAGVPYHR